MDRDDKTPLVEVFSGTSWEAELVRGLLESSGVRAALKNDDMVNFTSSTSFSFGGGMKVLVFAYDFDVASEILATRGNAE